MRAGNGEMVDSSDFTFCQVGLEVEDSNSGFLQAIPDVNRITLEDNPSYKVSRGTTSMKEHSDVSTSDGPVKTVTLNYEGSRMVTPKPVVKEELKPVIQEQKPTAKKPAVRAKVPFEKGHSQMDWLKLTRTDPDLAGLNGRSNQMLISMDEVKQHKTGGAIWTVLKGRVYNITPYMKFHPGGEDMLMKAAGKDCTSLFNKYHAWVNAEFLLEKCLVGLLDPN